MAFALLLMRQNFLQAIVIVALFIFTGLFAAGLALFTHDRCDEACWFATNIIVQEQIPPLSTIIPASETALSRTSTSAAIQRQVELAATIIYPTISYTQTQGAVNTAVATTQTQLAVQIEENQ